MKCPFLRRIDLKRVQPLPPPYEEDKTDTELCSPDTQVFQDILIPDQDTALPLINEMRPQFPASLNQIKKPQRSAHSQAISYPRHFQVRALLPRSSLYDQLPVCLISQLKQQTQSNQIKHIICRQMGREECYEDEEIPSEEGHAGNLLAFNDFEGRVTVQGKGEWDCKVKDDQFRIGDKLKVVCCMNLRKVQCKTEQQQQWIQLSVFTQRKCRFLRLKFNDFQQRDWFLAVLLSARDRDAKMEYTLGPSGFERERQSLKKALQMVNSFDIVLFRNGRFFSALQRFITNSDYDHAGVVVWSGGRKRLLDAGGSQGVNLFDLERVLQPCAYEEIAIRRYEGDRSEQQLKAVNSFVERVVGMPYRFDPLLLFGKPKSQEGYFCSEIVVAALQAGGVVSSEATACQFLPSKF